MSFLSSYCFGPVTESNIFVVLTRGNKMSHCNGETWNSNIWVGSTCNIISNTHHTMIVDLFRFYSKLEFLFFKSWIDDDIEVNESQLILHVIPFWLGGILLYIYKITRRDRSTNDDDDDRQTYYIRYNMLFALMVVNWINYKRN